MAGFDSARHFLRADAFIACEEMVEVPGSQRGANRDQFQIGYSQDKNRDDIAEAKEREQDGRCPFPTALKGEQPEET